MSIPYHRPYLNRESSSALSRVLKSGWLTTGSETSHFETAFAQYCQTTHAIMLSSGTAALHLALIAGGVKAGDEVITTPYTFTATSEVCEYIGAKVVLVDIRPDTLNIDETRVAEKITPRTKAIIPVHFGGHPCEMDTLLKVARQHGIFVIEDAAHCTPAYYRGKAVGSLSDVTCFSFYANKCITTGEGGMITCADDGLASQIRKLRLHGLSKDAINRYKQKNSWRYDVEMLGYKYNPTDLAAALGRTQLGIADTLHQKRQRVAHWYHENLTKLSGIILPTELSHVISSWHLYPIRLYPELRQHRDALIAYLAEQEIMTSMHFIPLYRHSYYRQKYGWDPGDYPVTEITADSEISLPLYPQLTRKQVITVSQVLEKFLDQL